MSSSSDEFTQALAVVIDNGSYSIKFGFANSADCDVLPSVIEGSHPIEKGIVTNWDAMEKVSITRSVLFLKGHIEL